MDINSFVANFQGGARANLYNVTITSLPNKLQFLAKSTALPGKDLGVIEVSYLNHKVPYRGDWTFQDWHTTILIDNDYAVINELNDWFKKMQSASEITGAGSLGEYGETATIEHLGVDGSPIATFEMYHLWPFSFPTTELSFESSDTISEIDVQFKYTYWEKTK
jgi:hypothetical protein